jgi:hypothetical protein
MLQLNNWKQVMHFYADCQHARGKEKSWFQNNAEAAVGRILESG